MSWIGIGVAIAIGFYLAPVIVAIVVGAFALVLSGISRLFGVR